MFDIPEDMDSMLQILINFRVCFNATDDLKVIGIATVK